MGFPADKPQLPEHESHKEARAQTRKRPNQDSVLLLKTLCCLLSIANNLEAERISTQPPLDTSWLPAAHWKQPHPGAAHQGLPAAPMKP